MFKEFIEIANKKITKIYKGKDNHCRCGCGGTYYYPEDRGFKRVLKNVEKTFNYYHEVKDIFPKKLTLERYLESPAVPACDGYVNIPVIDEARPELDQCYCIYFQN